MEMTKRQKQFLNEIKKYKYNKSEAYAELINSKSKQEHYSEFEKIIEYYFKNTFKIKFVNNCSIEICQRIVKADTLQKAIEEIEKNEPFTSVGEILESKIIE